MGTFRIYKGLLCSLQSSSKRCLLQSTSQLEAPRHSSFRRSPALQTSRRGSPISKTSTFPNKPPLNQLNQHAYLPLPFRDRQVLRCGSGLRHNQSSRWLAGDCSQSIFHPGKAPILASAYQFAPLWELTFGPRQAHHTVKALAPGQEIEYEVCFDDLSFTQHVKASAPN